MPWTVQSVPSNIAGLSPARKRQWVNVANAALKRYKDDGKAMMIANGVVKKVLGRSTAEKKDFELPGETQEYIEFLEGLVLDSAEPADELEGEVEEKESGSGSFFQRLKGWLGWEEPAGEDEWESGIPFQLKELPDGRLRYLTISTNNATDRAGETILAKAHEEYIEWAEKEGGYPELWPWHLAGGRLGVTDWMAFDGNFLLSSGLVDIGMEEKARAWAEDPETAMSHGFFPRRVGKDIVQYRQFEQSVLPRWAAANQFTDFTLGAKEMALTPEKRAALAEKGYTEEEIAGLERHTDQFRDKLNKMGVSVKDLTDAPATEPTPDPDPPNPDPKPGEPPQPFTLDDIRTVVREEFTAQSKELTGRIEKIEADTKALGESEDDKFSRLWETRRGAPPASRQQPQAVSAERKEADDSKGPWVNGIPIFNHPAFGMGGVGGSENGEMR